VHAGPNKASIHRSALIPQKGFVHVIQKKSSYTITQDLFYVDAITGYDQHHSPSSAEELDDGDDPGDPRS
jgi:hypothetical protein